MNPERRCLVPFTSFSEYGLGPAGKRPLFWFDVPSRQIVSFPGVWRPVEGGAVFAFLTTDPNPLVAPIHPKAMPVLLDEGDEDRWPTCSFVDAIALAKPFPSQLMTAQQDPAIGGQNQRQDSLFGSRVADTRVALPRSYRATT